MNLLVVGTLAFDSVETPFGTRDDTLGGSANFLALAASYFTDVRMVGVIGEDFPEEHLDLYRERGIDTDGVERAGGKTFRWKGKYNDNLNDRETIFTELNVLEGFNPKIPASYKDSRYIFLGNFDPDLQLKVLEQLNGPEYVALDTMNFWIERTNEQLKKVLQKVHMISVNDAEARQLSGEYNLVKAARAIQRMGPDTVVVKRGEHGALVFLNDSIFMAPAFPLEIIRDPTGAGDSFAGGLMGYLARCDKSDTDTLRQGVVMGSVLASFAVEDFSMERFRALSTGDIRNRYESFKSLTHFEVDPSLLWD